MFRAFRTLRSVAAFQGIQIIIATVWKSVPDMLNIVLLLVLAIFVLAIVGVTLFSPYYALYFGDLGAGTSPIIC